MKKALLTILLLTLFSNMSYSQEIQMKTNVTGYRFTQSGIKLSWKDLSNETKYHPHSYQLIKKAKSQNTISSILAYGGGALIGIPIGASISGDKPNMTLAYIGGGIAIIGLPLAINSSKNVRKGIDLYNSSLKSTSSFQPEFTVIATRNGIGLSMNF